MRGINTEEDLKPLPPANLGLPPPPPYNPRTPISRFDEPKYAPLPEQPKPYDQLIIPPPIPVDDYGQDNYPGANNEDRIQTASEIRPNPGAPEFTPI